MGFRTDNSFKFDDGREIELLHFVYGHPSVEEIRGSPQKLLEAIDEYGRTKKYLMNVGDDKGRIVTDLIADRKPQVMVELGGYVGYDQNPGRKICSRVEDGGSDCVAGIRASCSATL